MVFAVGEFNPVQLGDALHDVGYLLTEAFGDVSCGDVGVFHGVMEQAGGDSRGVHLELCKDLRDRQRMADVGLAGGTLLALVVLEAEGPGGADEVEVVAGAVGANGIQQAFEARFKAGGFRRQWYSTRGRSGGGRCFEVHTGFAGC